MSAESSGQLSRPAWAVDSSMMLTNYRINLPDAGDAKARFVSDVHLRPPFDRRLPRAPFFLGYALSKEENGDIGSPFSYRVLHQFWMVCEEMSAQPDRTWVFTSVCQSPFIVEPRFSDTKVTPSFSIISESWAPWNAFMSTTWSSLQQKHVQFVPNEKYMLTNGGHMLFNRHTVNYLCAVTSASIHMIAWTPDLQKLGYAMNSNRFYQPRTPALTDKEVQDWYRTNAPRLEFDGDYI